MSNDLLIATGMTTGYGMQTVLRDVCFTLGNGSIGGIIGPNGAGKTTLLRSLSGLLPLTAGRVTFDGKDITSLSPRERMKLGIAYVPQERNVFANLSVLENLEIAVTSFIDPSVRFRRQIDVVYSLFPLLRERQRQLAGSMSGGEQRMVAIAIGLMAAPRVLLLDEPTTGLAPKAVHHLMSAIKALNVDHGISAVVVEQNILSMLKIVDSVQLLKDGRAKSYPGRPSDLTQQKLWEYL
jgi:branched-chain amino acid transport system ATP-binding protein